MKSDETAHSLKTWSEMHDSSYFFKHPHYRNMPFGDIPGAEYLNSEVLSDYSKVGGEDVVLEVGCGYGRLVYDFSKVAKEVKGIDLHRVPIDYGNKHLKAKFDNAELMVFDGLNFPFSYSYFTVVYSVCVMQHIPDSIVVNHIKEASRVLKDGGRMVYQFLMAPLGNRVFNTKKRQEQSVGRTDAKILSFAEFFNGECELKRINNAVSYLVGTKAVHEAIEEREIFEEEEADEI
jgi:SAM-dependent methyltransferase